MIGPEFLKEALSPRSRIRPLEPEPPAWVRDLLQDGQCDRTLGHPHVHSPLDVVRRDPYVLVTARVPDALSLAARDLSRCVSAHYAGIEAFLANVKRRPIRFWNYVPGITDTIEPGLDRYMAFNRGRYSAYAESWQTEGTFERAVPTASAVGIAGPDLVIHCLASTLGGRPVDNPRQTASWRYSHRYGPKPPCFARGTISVLAGRRMLLLGGTASIVGEESRHHGDVRAQVLEALTNIEAVIVSGGGPRRKALERLTDVRLYLVNSADAGVVEGLIRVRTVRTLRIEPVLARVCRPELLVEIEGLADLRPDRH